MDNQANLLLKISDALDKRLVKQKRIMIENIETIMSESKEIDASTADGILVAVGSGETWSEMKNTINGLQAILDVIA